MGVVNAVGFIVADRSIELAGKDWTQLMCEPGVTPMGQANWPGAPLASGESRGETVQTDQPQPGIGVRVEPLRDGLVVRQEQRIDPRDPRVAIQPLVAGDQDAVALRGDELGALERTIEVDRQA